MKNEQDAGATALSRPRDWGQYWQSGWVTSFAEQFPANYDGSIREFWQRQLAGKLDAVVDVACGNGALTWIVDAFVNRPSGTTRVVGIDSAAIDPFEALGRTRSDHPNVSFIGNVAAEALPFHSGSVDLVVSQYGVEYTDLDRSIAEIARVLKPSGRMAFVMHNAESSVVVDATRHLEAFRAVVNLNIHEHALELFDLGRRLKTPQERQGSTAFKALTATLDRLTAEVRTLVRGHSHRSAIHKYMDELMEVFAYPRGERDRARERIIAVGEGFCAHVRKMEHMKAAALTASGRERLVGLIEKTGYVVTEIGEMAYRHETNIGTALVAKQGGTS